MGSKWGITRASSKTLTARSFGNDSCSDITIYCTAKFWLSLNATDERKKYLAFALIVVFVVSGMAVFSSYYPQGSVTHSTTISSSTSSSSYEGGQGYLSVPKVYSDLGYPKVTYSDYFPYLPSKPNFTMEYQTKNLNFQVGPVENASVIGLNQAVGLAIERLNLTVQLQLAYATFYPGTIVNSTLAIHPEWYLFLAGVYDGFWAYGSYGNGAFSVEADVDALTGAAPSGSGGIDLSSLPNSGHYELDVNSSRALETVRAEGGSIAGVPPELTENGTVSLMEPRIVLLGRTSNNAAFQNPLDALLSGQKRLCWVIQLYSPAPEYGYQGTFAVDAVTGKLISGWAASLLPSMHTEAVGGYPDFSSVKNFTASQEIFQINGSIVGRTNPAPVAVPTVVLARPGSNGSIALNFTSTIANSEFNATLSSSNPLPGIQTLSSTDGLPQGVSLRFTKQSVIIPQDGSTTSQLLITVDRNAPSGTYLIEVDGMLGGQPGATKILFFLTVWDGLGQWPPPPTVK